MTTPEQFFFRHAGFSWDPATQTREQGRAACAQRLAQAEAWAHGAGVSFAWENDWECDSSEWSDEGPAYPQWQCIARDVHGTVIGSLGCVDFGPEGDPWSDPYRRVCEAEIALEAMPS
jgi:hypothetical protein